jgi:hypothetical protein
MDLLARGYAVEIVSPDSIPDNIADLELRVEAGPGDQLTASVEAHDGARSASLEFVHHLKAPMGDFIRRPPEPGAAVHFPEEPVSFNAEQSIEDVQLPAEAPQLAPKTVSPAAETLRDPELDPQHDPEESARLISPPEPLPSLPVEPPSHFAAEAPTIARPIAQPMVQPTIVQPTMVQSTMVRPTTVRPTRESQRRDRPADGFWHAALAFATVVLLALVVGFGMRRTGKASAQSSGAAPAEKVAAASTDVNVLRTPAAGHVSALAVSPPATKSKGNSGHAPKESQVAKAGAATASPSNAGPQARVSRRHGDDLIARDTVTYLDKRFDKRASTAKPANPLPRTNPSSRKHDGGVIAANAVTYLDKKPAPKAAKPDSGIKHYSDLK